MNTGNAQILNCFRIMLNAVGLNFKLTQDGPVKGAHVGWEGLMGTGQLEESRGGPAQIVRLVGDPSTDRLFSSRNTIGNSVTDSDGKVRVGVEGVGQREKKPENAPKVMKRRA